MKFLVRERGNRKRRNGLYFVPELVLRVEGYIAAITVMALTS